MDYEKKYKEAINRAKAMVKVANSQEEIYNSVITIFPELKESEDERIRKWLVDTIKAVPNDSIEWEIIDKSDIIAWLEKQGEQKEYTFKSIPRLLDMIEPSDRAKAYCQKLIDTLAKEGYNTDAKIVEGVLKGWNGEDVPMAVMDEKQGEQKPTDEDMKEALRTEYEKGRADAIAEMKKPAWSEDDEKRLQSCINILKAKSLMGKVDTANTMWLKSLKQRIGG